MLSKGNSKWKYEHRVAHERYLSGKPPLPLSATKTERLDFEFANAMRARREQEFQRRLRLARDK
jgi:hypothetical protein